MLKSARQPKEKVNTLKKAQRQKNIIAYAFTVPAVILNSFFIFIPLIYSLVISFMDFNLFKGFTGSKFIGLQNFVELVSDQAFLTSLRNNLVYMVWTIPIVMVLSLVLAVVINEGIYFKNMARGLFFIPYVASISAMALVWAMLLNPEMGIINNFLREIGISQPPMWLASSKTAMYGIILMSIWGQLGYNIVIFISGLQGIDQSLYEASSIDGATFIQKFFKITLPLVSPTTFFLLVTNIISSFQVFGSVNIMTNGGPGDSTSVISFYMYKMGFAQNRMGYASAIAWVLMLAIFIVTVFQLKGQKKWVHY